MKEDTHTHTNIHTQYMLYDSTQNVLCGFENGQNKYGAINKNSGCIKTVGDGHVHTAVFRMGNQ